VRARAMRDGVSLDRPGLQDTGMRLIAEGWPAFVDELLTEMPSRTDILIVDGVRHVEAATEVRQRFPGAFFLLVFLFADTQDVERRVAQRGEELGGQDHQVESSLEAVARIADLSLDTSLPTEMMVTRIQRAIPRL
jgi:hypothetical protein